VKKIITQAFIGFYGIEVVNFQKYAIININIIIRSIKMKSLISAFLSFLCLFPVSALAQSTPTPSATEPAAMAAPQNATQTLLIIVGIVAVIAVVLFFIVKQPKKGNRQ